MSSLSKIKTIFSIIVAFDKIKYKFENGAVLRLSKKLVIAATNPLVCYLIVKVSYVGLLLITNLILIGIEFEFFGEASCTYDGPIKLGRETRPS